MNFQQYFQYIFSITNISLALFFSIWQLLIPFISVLSTDIFFIICLYLVALFATIFFLLMASDLWVNRLKSMKLFFLTLNIIFIAFLFFEV